jgi:urease accessory protein
MLNVHEVIAAAATSGPGPGGTPLVAGGTVTLTFDERRRSRLLAVLDDGRELALRLPRGSVLRDGDFLRADDGSVVVAVRAAAESLSVARSSQPRLLARVAYHLGNRHVPVEVGDGWVAYEHDHVLDTMVRALGLDIEARLAPFEPEVGAFHGAGGHRHDPHHDGDGDQAGHAHSNVRLPDGGGHDHDHDDPHDHGGGSHHHR